MQLEKLHCGAPTGGAVAQLGERLNGIQEVEGSIPFGSTQIMGFQVLEI